MAKKFKDYYDRDWAELLAYKIKQTRDQFDSLGFVSRVVGVVKDKEFLDRQDAIVEVFEEVLGKNYQKNVQLFTTILGPKLQKPEGMFTKGFWLWPIGRYIEKHGLENVDVSIDFIYELTQRFTGEFAIRPILEEFPQKTLRMLLNWSKDNSEHVRRLASEGMRMRLPWASRSQIFVDYFDDSIKILDNLKSDEFRFVQKSVANNLNDLSKTHPELVVETTSRWLREDQSKETQWIVKHALRSINKKK